MRLGSGHLLLLRWSDTLFLSILNEYRQAKKVTRRRLYLESLAEVLSRVDKVVISSKVAGKTLPLLSLGDLSGSASARGGKSGETK